MGSSARGVSGSARLPAVIGDPAAGRLVDIGDTRLWVLEMGEGHPLIMLHGGPGLDHTELRPWLDPLSRRFRLLFVDQRSQGRSDRTPQDTWILSRMAQDVSALAAAMDLDRFAVFGQSYGSFVALQHAVDMGTATHYVLAGCVPSARWLDRVEKNLAVLEPPELRDRVAASWDRESTVQTEDEMRELFLDQLPFHFARPEGPAIEEFRAGIGAMRFAPDVLRAFAGNDPGAIDVEDELPEIESPVLVIAGEADRVTVPEAGYAIAEAVPQGDFVILRDAGHMMHCESPRAFRTAIEDFFDRFSP